MSEKGQGEESTLGAGAGAGAAAGAATGADGGAAGAAAGGSGSQADQSGPAGDPLGGLTPRDFPPPPTPEEPAPTEPEFPGAGPTDTRSGWDTPSEASAVPDEGADASPDAKDAAEARRQRGYDDAMRARDARREREQGPQPEPPPLEDSKAPDQGTTGSYFDPDDEKPVLS